MIRLSRLNGKDFVLNSDLVKTIEETPDTLVTLVNGEKMMVRETVQVMLDRIIAFRKETYGRLSVLRDEDARSGGRD
jgi:flagellar protein FlbD